MQNFYITVIWIFLFLSRFFCNSLMKDEKYEKEIYIPFIAEKTINRTRYIHIALSVGNKESGKGMRIIEHTFPLPLSEY